MNIDYTYICHWPGCKFATKTRSCIDLHHIVPKELRPRLNQFVTLSFCPTHHRMIYHPDSLHGAHSIKAPNKLIIKHIYPCAPNGYSVEYENMRGEIFTEEFNGSYVDPLNDETKFI